uniref:Small ribosomal subunit protein uS8c n=1 Tax=Cynomorium coccineum TaxID=51503 RepID=A0A1B1FBT0_9MAGN|nr:ribosomal protein S8 [Cynomorium coccineum]ANQ38714.1 ribosomal protein S8 [Cynomorium coccineum]
MSKNTITNIINYIQNCYLNRKKKIKIASTNITENIVNILLREGFIENAREHWENNKSYLVLTLKNNKISTYRLKLKQISRSNLRIYLNYKKIPRILGGIGIVILSTSRGIMTDREARLKRIGGEILIYIW